MEKQAPNSEERTWAAIAHVSVLLFFFGLAAPAAIWAFLRKKSSYLAFQSLQALGYQITGIILVTCIISISPMLIIAATVPLVILFADTPDTGSIIPIIIYLAMFAAMAGSFGAYLLMGLVGAFLSFQGRDFRYPILGNWMYRYLAHTHPAAGKTEAQDA